MLLYIFFTKTVQNNEQESIKEKEEESTHCNRCDIRFETKKAYEEHLIHSALHVDGVQWVSFSIPNSVFSNRFYRWSTT